MLIKLAVEIATGGDPAQAIAQDPALPGLELLHGIQRAGQHISGEICDNG